MSALSTQEIRIRLEGRLELLELAGPRYARLAGLLRGFWRRHAIEQRPLIEDVLEQEDSVSAALDEIGRLADREDLGPDAAPRRLAVALQAQRTRLHQRLIRKLPGAAATSLRDGLAKLHQVSQSVHLPRPDELVVLEGSAARAMPLWALTLIPTLAALSFYGGLAAAGVAVSMICFGLAVLPLGKYTLLADRLVWVPYRGDPVEIAHSDLGVERIELRQQGRGLALYGKQVLNLPVLTSQTELAALLMLYRDGPLKGVNRPPSGTTMILGASASPGKWLERPASRLGVVLLHADGLCFLGRGVAPELLRRVCANRLEVPVSEEFLLEQLTRLTPEALTEALKVVDGFDGGVAVSSLAVEPEKSGTPTELLRLNVRTTKLEIPIGAVDFEALRTLFPWTQDQSRQVP